MNLLLLFSPVVMRMNLRHIEKRLVLIMGEMLIKIMNPLYGENIQKVKTKRIEIKHLEPDEYV